MLPSFWKNKKVFITGHTGFKGSWMTLCLLSFGSKIKGYSLEPPTQPSLFSILKLDSKIESIIGDIRNYEKLKKEILIFDPDIIIHLAAQPLVRYSYLYPLETYSTNVMGTANLLEASKKIKNLRSIVCISSDKCYQNIETRKGYNENDPMGGDDPYSSSKGCTELVVSAFNKSFYYNNDNAFIASARAGNVIGGGDWALDRLIPDIINSLINNNELKIRNPKAIRPWQHVLEPLFGYLILAQKLYSEGDKYSQAWNFGPDYENCKSVDWILNYFKENYKNINYVFEKSSLHEAKLLMLDCSKAKNKLHWNPKWNISKTLDYIIDWYSNFENNSDMFEVCEKRINNYLNNF